MKIRSVLLLSLTLATAAQAADEAATELWTAKCKSCHGPDGRAQTQMGKKESIVDISQPAWQQAQTDADIREVIADGSPRNKKMKAYKDKLTPQQIDALVAYIRGMKKG
jgi:mono/diheme cytochrome c family protein